MKKGRAYVGAAAALVLFQATPSAAQDRAEVMFGGEVFDVTGAGELDLGILDDALTPFRRHFAQRREPLGVEVTIDADGAVQDCRIEAAPRLAAAGKALCEQALRVGRFRQHPLLVLDYTRATYRLSIRSHRDKPAKGEAEFRAYTAYPFYRSAVIFGSYTITPGEARLTSADIDLKMMSYPSAALQNAVEAQVIVAVTFDAEGRVASCRPIRSSNTARIAYDTCREAQRGFSLRNPPDARPYVWSTRWVLAE